MWSLLLACSSPPPTQAPLHEPPEPVVEAADPALVPTELALPEPSEPAAAVEAVASPERQRSLALLEPLPQDALGELLPYAPDGGRVSGVAVALTRKVEIAGVWCAEQLLLDDVGTVGCKLAQDHRFADYVVRRGARVSFWPGQGSLDRFTFFDLEPPKQQLTIQGVPCLNAADLHPTGAVRSCVLARSAKVGGAPLPQGAQVVLSEGGSLSAVVAFDTFTLWGVEYGPGTLILREGKVAEHLSGQF